MTRRARPVRRAAALGACAVYVLAFVALLVFLADNLAAVLGAWASLLVVTAGAWHGLTRRGTARGIGVGVAALALAAAAVLLVAAHAVVGLVSLGAFVALAAGLGRFALGTDRAALRAAPPPGVAVPPARRGVLLMNPRSGGGKVERFGLEEAARARGIEPIVLRPGDDLEALARVAVARDADVLGMAGGDGSQALVARIAAEHDRAFVCIPAGTRNHLALDLGVDRDDVVGALDAFGEAYERRIDLAEVGERVFVNNVSLGVYARIVQSEAYRDDKLGTIATMLPELLGPDAEPFDLRFDGPEGNPHDRADLVLVSNNRYELERLGGFGSRARLDGGVLGVVVVEVKNAAEVAELVAAQTAGAISRFRGWRSWTPKQFDLRSAAPVEAGVDGEALLLDPPLHFRTRPGALRVRVAPRHPGYSPAATAEAVGRGALVRLLRVAAGRDPGGPDPGGPAPG